MFVKNGLPFKNKMDKCAVNKHASKQPEVLRPDDAYLHILSIWNDLSLSRRLPIKGLVCPPTVLKRSSDDRNLIQVPAQ